MALYAFDEDDLICANQAESRKIYWCLDCFGPVKRRRGKRFFPHFYHVKTSPGCRLYSKTEDHLLAQLELQKSFPEGALQMEKPFPKISRIADLCWEKEKVIFEIQCSPLTEKEAEQRVLDYQSIGYDVVWLLDDARYNRRAAGPTEQLLRRKNAYYMTVRKRAFFQYYDQFEVFSEGRRVKRGRRMPIDLQKIYRTPKMELNGALFPQQILELRAPIYFFGDRLDKALRNQILSLQYWKTLELHYKQTATRNKLKTWFLRFVIKPYTTWIEKLVKRYC